MGARLAAAEGTSLTDPKFFRTAKDFRRWLEAHASRESELVVGFYKVDSGHPCMSWSESVDEALCFGWIDGVRKRIDDESYLIRFSRRKPTSIWSAINIRKYQDLEGKGRMTAAGRAAYSKRKTAKSVVYSYEQAEVARLSPTEIKSFRRLKVAWKFLESAPPSYRKMVLHWVTSAKKSETRASRLARLMQASAAGRRL